ncbi:MAG: lipoyl(octanoyl) transferase LipB [bacterium JZ-2024 1]
MTQRQHISFENRPLGVMDLGKRDFSSVWEMQHSLVEIRAEGKIPDCLLLVEHPPVITLGRRANRKHLLVDSAILQGKGVGIFEIERGGDITYHGPGQLIGYPIVLLPRGIRDVIPFVRGLEEVLIHAVGFFGVEGFRKKGFTGVWTHSGKIAAIGVAVKHNVTFHGFALNVSPSLEHFRWIVPCGIPDCPVTSMEKILGYAPERESVKASVLQGFREVFHFCIESVEERLWETYFRSQPVRIG